MLLPPRAPHNVAKAADRMAPCQTPRFLIDLVILDTYRRGTVRRTVEAEYSTQYGAVFPFFSLCKPDPWLPWHFPPSAPAAGGRKERAAGGGILRTAGKAPRQRSLRQAPSFGKERDAGCGGFCAPNVRPQGAAPEVGTDYVQCAKPPHSG